MIKVFLIGTLGADCEKKNVEGNKFTTMRVAHNEVWTDEAGQEHSNTIWVDATLSDHPKVTEFLKRGTQVFMEGYPSLRVYSSPKDRCMKAGMTIRVQRIELLGGKVDPIPRELIDGDAQIHRVNKFFNVQGINKPCQMVDKHGNLYDIDTNGWVSPHPLATETTEVQQAAGTQQTDVQQAAGAKQTDADEPIDMSQKTKTGKDGKVF